MVGVPLALKTTHAPLPSGSTQAHTSPGDVPTPSRYHRAVTTPPVLAAPCLLYSTLSRTLFSKASVDKNKDLCVHSEHCAYRDVVATPRPGLLLSTMQIRGRWTGSNVSGVGFNSNTAMRFVFSGPRRHAARPSDSLGTERYYLHGIWPPWDVFVRERDSHFSMARKLEITSKIYAGRVSTLYMASPVAW